MVLGLGLVFLDLLCSGCCGTGLVVFRLFGLGFGYFSGLGLCVRLL